MCHFCNTLSHMHTHTLSPLSVLLSPLFFFVSFLGCLNLLLHISILCSIPAVQKARFEKGKESLETEFRGLLTRYSKPVPPILILDAIGVDDELEVQEEVTLEHLPEAVLQDIIIISGWLVEYGRTQGRYTHTHTHTYAHACSSLTL